MKAIGFTNKYYTLWEVFPEELTLQINGEQRFSGIKMHHIYLQNLSMSLKEAKAKFEKLTGEKAPEPDKELYGKNRRFATIKEFDPYKPEEFNQGKYTGQLITDCTDYNYLRWAYANILFGKRQEIAGKVLESAGYRKSLDGEEMLTVEEYNKVVEQDKAEKQAQAFIERIKKAGQLQIEVVFQKNLNQYGQYYSPEYSQTIQFPFDKIRVMSYNGYPYALPLVNNTAKRIKGKKVTLTVEYVNNADGWAVLKVKSIDNIE